MNRCRSSIVTAVCITLLSSAAISQEKEDAKPKTHTVKAGPFKVEVTLDGVFEAQQIEEIILRPEVWSTLKVDEVVAEGTRVKQGDPILKVETEKLDDEIRDQELALKLSELSLRQAQVELESLEKSVPLDLEAARRAERIADEELQYFLKVTEDRRKESAKESLKNSEYSLEYAQEELDQLEQMYKADDLTEETEEIILKRARRSVERSEYSLRLARDRYERAMTLDLPREKQRVEETADREQLDLRKAEATLPRSLEKQQIELQKQKYSHEQLEEKLEQLNSDRKLMTIESPVDGRVFYGQAERGKWTTAATVRKQLRPAGTATANTVLMTVVADRPQVVRVDVPEKEFRHVTEGAPAVIKPTAFPDTTYDGKCSDVSPVAVKEGTFDGRIAFDAGDGDSSPVPGMTCKVTITPYEKENAIAVPSSAVFGEGEDRHVFVRDGDESEKQSVQVGKTSGDKIEILDGLSEGDVILLEKP